MKIWYFHGQYKVSSLGINKISYNIFDLRQMSKVASHFHKKNKMFIYSFKYANKESRKILKSEAAEPYLEPCQIYIMDGVCIIDVWYGHKYTPEVAQDSKFILQWINTKILEKTMDLFSVDLLEDILT